MVTPKPRATPRARPSFHPRNADTPTPQSNWALTSTKAPTKTRGAPPRFDGTVWVHARAEVARRRVFAKGADDEQFINDWMSQENSFLTANQPWLRADLLVGVDLGHPMTLGGDFGNVVTSPGSTVTEQTGARRRAVLDRRQALPLFRCLIGSQTLEPCSALVGYANRLPYHRLSEGVRRGHHTAK